jgi:hypothetical protein
VTTKRLRWLCSTISRGRFVSWADLIASTEKLNQEPAELARILLSRRCAYWDTTSRQRRKSLADTSQTTITATILVVCLSMKVSADPMKPALPTWHKVEDSKYTMQMDSCPSDTPLYRDGLCVSDAWLKMQHDISPATQADIDRLQQQINDLRQK